MIEKMTKSQKCNAYHARRIERGAKWVRVILEPPAAHALNNLIACGYGKDMTAVVARAIQEAADER